MGSLKAIQLGKTFPGVVALDQVDFEVRGGAVHALVGANGAGKSTLIKILTGYYPSYRGRIELDGEPITIARPADAMAAGIEVVHQEVDTTLIPYLTVAENLLIQQIAVDCGSPMVRWRRFFEEARRVAERVGLAVDVARRVEDLTLHQKQLLVIARALSRRVRYLILDEPTASLSLREADRLMAIIRDLRRQGVGIVYVSHRLPEVTAIADEVTVLRGGRQVAHFSDPPPVARIVEAILGRPADEAYPSRTQGSPGDVLLEARGLSRGGRVRNVSFQLRRGEVLGITGMVGAGKTELLRLLFGADVPDAGELILEGKRLRLRRPQDAVRHGIFLVPEERRQQGLLVEGTIRENMSLPFLEELCRASLVSRSKERRYALERIQALGITPPEPEACVQNLSGGNQQKVVIGKWFGRGPRVMLFDEASQGIDIGAKRDVYALARRVSREAGVIYASSDIDETLALADRILVMRDGAVVAEMPAPEADRQIVLEYSTGARG